ncbi:MAG: HAD hydrolase family protein [Ignavibacteriales bacterium]|nr:HAD hydrolase family protein [Ignavibacteriales bacterium]
MEKKLKNKIKKIKFVITDVDGVLTDGGLYYTNDGLVMKKFQVKDGMGTALLRNAGIEYGIISTDVSEMAIKRAERLKMNFCYIAIENKAEKVREICKEKNLKLENIAFIGDDVNDISIMKIAGLTACPKDATAQIKKLSDYICKKNGGEGAFREFVDLILENKK